MNRASALQGGRPAWDACDLRVVRGPSGTPGWPDAGAAWHGARGPAATKAGSARVAHAPRGRREIPTGASRARGWSRLRAEPRHLTTTSRGTL